MFFVHLVSVEKDRPYVETSCVTGHDRQLPRKVLHGIGWMNLQEQLLETEAIISGDSFMPLVEQCKTGEWIVCETADMDALTRLVFTAVREGWLACRRKYGLTGPDITVEQLVHLWMWRQNPLSIRPIENPVVDGCLDLILPFLHKQNRKIVVDPLALHYPQIAGSAMKEGWNACLDTEYAVVPLG
jgi:hypothetical protein